MIRNLINNTHNQLHFDIKWLSMDDEYISRITDSYDRKTKWFFNF